MSVAIELALLLLVSLAAWTDMRSRRIPNGLSGAGVILGLTLNFQHNGFTGLVTSLQGLTLALAVYLFLYMLRAMGAGDAKLMAAVGSLTGPANWLALMVFVAVAGGLIAIVVVSIRGRWRTTLHNAGLATADLIRLRAPANRRPQLDVSSGEGLTLPHAVPIALGVFAFVLTRIAR